MVVAYGRLDDLAGDPEGHCLAQGCLLGLEPPGLCAPLVSLPDGVLRARGTVVGLPTGPPCNLWLVVASSRVARRRVAIL